MSTFRAALVHARENLRIIREGVVDIARTLRWSSRVDSAYNPHDTWSLECQMTKDYHRVEKGLALAEPKRPFGSSVEARLTAGLPELHDSSPLRAQVDSAVAALRTWNADGVVDPAVAPRLSSEESRPVPDSWFSGRHSVRDFSLESKPTIDEICDAVGLASRSTPSVCNRQAWRAYVSVDPNIVRSVLAHQNGNAGFRESVPCVIVITVRRQLFAGAGERRQLFVDGGLFAMTTAWTLHARGLGSCMLNWSMSNAQSSHLRSAIGATQDEEIITLMAVGYASEGVRVARSPRRSSDEVIRVLES